MSRNEKNENKQQNNTLPCEVVKEILPLYHDGIVSKETKERVEEHLASCEECSKELQKLEEQLPVPADDEGVRESFDNLKKKSKKRTIIIGAVCAAVLAGIAFFAAWFLQNAMIMEYSPEDITVIKVFRAVYPDCKLPDYTHYEGDDDGVLIYMEAPWGGDVEVTRENGSIELTFKHPIMNRDIYEAGLKKDFYYIPVKPGDKTVSVNGKTVCTIADLPAENPDYVYAYHEFSHSGKDGSWDINQNPSGYTFTYCPDSNKQNEYVTWDLAGNVLKDTRKTDSEDSSSRT